MVEREVVNIAALHLEGEANTWWFSHLSHARVTTFAEFTQRVIKNFGKEKSEEENPSPPLEEIRTNTDETMEEKKKKPTVGGTIKLEEQTLAAIQNYPKLHQGMPKFPFPIVSTNFMEGCIPLHDQGSTHTADLEQQTCTCCAALSCSRKG